MLFGMNPSALRIDGKLSDPPPVTNGATVLVYHVGNRAPDRQAFETRGNIPQLPALQMNSKFLGNFKLPKFDGSAQWKGWNKAFTRYLSIHQLDYVLEDEFLNLLPLSQEAFSANKLVYYIIEDAIVAGSLAAKYFRLAAKWNGHQAYFCLHDGYVLAGPQTATLPLNELANLRFNSDETASGFCLRLRELFEDLEMVPGNASVVMGDTQKIGYLLTGIRQEHSLDSVYVHIQQAQRRGDMTFDEACADLHHRCEAIHADELLYTQVKDKGRKVLVSTQGKRKNQVVKLEYKKPCLEKDCGKLVKPNLPLCPLHYHQGVSGKTPSIVLKDGLGTATYSTETHSMVYPPSVPTDRLPVPRDDLKTVKRKELVAIRPIKSSGSVNKWRTCRNISQHL
jgi:hypothetical protein